MFDQCFHVRTIEDGPKTIFQDGVRLETMAVSGSRSSAAPAAACLLGNIWLRLLLCRRDEAYLIGVFSTGGRSPELGQCLPTLQVWIALFIISQCLLPRQVLPDDFVTKLHSFTSWSK